VTSAGAFALLMLVSTAGAVGAEVTACSTFSEDEAAKVLGGPLGAVYKSEAAAADDNGNEHKTQCGHFPKGYDLDKAEGPPERGVLVTLHTMPSGEAAKRYYDGVLEMLKGMPEAQGGGAKITTVSGIGSGAYLKPTPLPNSASKIVTLTFLKGSVMADVQIWKSSGPVDQVAREAARLVMAKLP
jgi:hypothetical protein